MLLYTIARYYTYISFFSIFNLDPYFKNSENTIVAVIVVARYNLIAYHINVGNFLVGDQLFFIQV